MESLFSLKCILRLLSLSTDLALSNLLLLHYEGEE